MLFSIETQTKFFTIIQHTGNRGVVLCTDPTDSGHRVDTALALTSHELHQPSSHLPEDKNRITYKYIHR